MEKDESVNENINVNPLIEEEQITIPGENVYSPLNDDFEPGEAQDSPKAGSINEDEIDSVPTASVNVKESIPKLEEDITEEVKEETDAVNDAVNDTVSDVVNDTPITLDETVINNQSVINSGDEINITNQTDSTSIDNSSVDSSLISSVVEGDSSKEEVTQLQNQLISAGYDLPKFGADGILGSETINAINRYKDSTNIDSTSITLSNESGDSINTINEGSDSNITTSTINESVDSNEIPNIINEGVNIDQSSSVINEAVNLASDDTVVNSSENSNISLDTSSTSINDNTSNNMLSQQGEKAAQLSNISTSSSMIDISKEKISMNKEETSVDNSKSEQTETTNTEQTEVVNSPSESSTTVKNETNNEETVQNPVNVNVDLSSLEKRMKNVERLLSSPLEVKVVNN